MKVENILHEEIVQEFDHLKGLKVGSDEYKVAVDGLTKLVDKAIEIDKLNLDAEEKSKTRETEERFKQQQMEEEKKDRFVKNCIAVAGIAVPTLVTIWGTKVSIMFEKEGTFTTLMGRGFINKLLPKK